VISPFDEAVVFVGWKDIPIKLEVMTPALNRLSVTVGMRVEVAGDRVPRVRPTGPRLE